MSQVFNLLAWTHFGIYVSPLFKDTFITVSIKFRECCIISYVAWLVTALKSTYSDYRCQFALMILLQCLHLDGSSVFLFFRVCWHKSRVIVVDVFHYCKSTSEGKTYLSFLLFILPNLSAFQISCKTFHSG